MVPTHAIHFLPEHPSSTQNLYPPREISYESQGTPYFLGRGEAQLRHIPTVSAALVNKGVEALYGFVLLILQEETSNLGKDI